MSVGLAVLLVVFVVLLLLEVPVAFVIGIATLLGALALGRDGSFVTVSYTHLTLPTILLV